MSLPGKYSIGKLMLISLAGAIFIIYPNIINLTWDLKFMCKPIGVSYFLSFIFRYIFFTVLIGLLLWCNLNKFEVLSIQKRLLRNFLITVTAYLIYVGISFLLQSRSDCFTSILLFQFFVTCIICTFIGHASMLYYEKSRKEQEIEQLKIENLKSRYSALTNQINPHFFFNSLNGITALIRKKNDENTLSYVNNLSDIFRYILQSERKGLVTVEEELEFARAFRYMMEVRFANKLNIHIDVPEELLNLKIPVLSLLPLFDNIIVHNIIDSEHKMTIQIFMTDEKELVVCNPIYPKLDPPETSGTGLQNLENRFTLLVKKEIRIEDNGNQFCVYLPLIED